MQMRMSKTELMPAHTDAGYLRDDNAENRRGEQLMDNFSHDGDHSFELMTFAYTAKLLHDSLNGKGIVNRTVMAFLDSLSSRLPEIVEALEKTAEEVSLAA